jgi:uncharacterized protein YhbP (UPF0306 family)
MAVVEITNVSAGVDRMAALASLFSILDTTSLCTIATCDSNREPAAATAFYALDRDNLVLYVLTRLHTEHCQNIVANGRAALTVFATTQNFTDAKRGVQLTAAAAPTSPEGLEHAFGIYLAAYPELGNWVETASDIEEKLDGCLFSFVIEHGKVFDEPKFGTEVWIDVDFAEREPHIG